MANVTVSPVVPFNNEDEQKSEYVHDGFSRRQNEDMVGWMKFIAVKDGWLHDKHPGKDQFDCPYCNESGEWVGIRCGTCGQLWDLQDEHAILLR